MLTPYLAQLRELRDALDGTIGDQDASDLAVAIKQGDGQSPPGGLGGGGKGGGGGGRGGAPPDSGSRIRVATGGFVLSAKASRTRASARIRFGVWGEWFGLNAPKRRNLRGVEVGLGGKEERCSTFFVFSFELRRFLRWEEGQARRCATPIFV